MKAKNFNNILCFDILAIERFADKPDINIFPKGEKIFFNVETPFMVEPIREDNIKLSDVCKLHVNNTFYYISKSDFYETMGQ